MSKIFKSFFTTVIFMLGLSMGMYYGVTGTEKEVTEKKQIIDSVQDVVIKNVQNEYEKEIEILEETISVEERVSPYAKMAIEKEFSKCGHTTVKVMDIPKELINLTRKEIEEKYSGWDVREFSPEEFTIFRVIDANCEDHYVLKENERVHCCI